MKTTDNNQNKQLTELSDEELKQVNGGGQRIQKRNCKEPGCPNTILDKNGCPKCI